MTTTVMSGFFARILKMVACLFPAVHARYKRWLVPGLCFFSLAGAAQIMTYNPGLTTNLSPVAGSSDPNVTGTSIVKSSGATGYCNSFYTGCSYYQITANSVAGQAYCGTVVPTPSTTPDFFSFTLTPNVGYVMNITGLSITCGSYGSASSSGAKKVMLAYKDGANPWVSSVFTVTVGSTGGCAPMATISWPFVLSTNNTVIFKVIPFNSTVCDCSTHEFAFNKLVVLGNLVLPVELVSFSAQKLSGGNIHLGWITASEKDNDYFDVEYSVNAIDFFYYSRVKGRGNITTGSTYDLRVDKDFGDDVPYFRLKQVDFEGELRYSWIITLPEYESKNVDFSVTYSAEKRSVVAGFYLDNARPVDITVFDLTGQKIFAAGMQLYNKGLNEVFIDPGATGMYLVEYADNTGQQVRKKIVFPG